MKEWIMELCPEVAGWQAELIAEQALRNVLIEREACAYIADSYDDSTYWATKIAADIRARSTQ